METPIFKIIEEELLQCRERIDSFIKTLHEIDAYFPDKPDIALLLARAVLKYEDTSFLIEKLTRLQWNVMRGKFEEDK
ncbi:MULTISPECIES: hypothetical protein [unclassified Nostoc]|uniref:hypothetical protein n=1 Tax=unclassified Nostoc TaxID=2593658 RepID=UPI002AD282E2|nr:hypothetical protein [Nostoc sp. DedQUE03]MDZ7975506.1 hypothetical protein [Nostoc sp. DedQUE03]MDZ8045556.1 hypothetical protein [Nostoc sp. DedQUE02]